MVLNGQAHDYERFAPQNASGVADPTNGVTEFVVGTGGDDFQAFGSSIANSVIRNNTSFGVMKMTLHATGYDWQFLPAAGYSFTDSGSASCHSAPLNDAVPPTQPTALSATATTASAANLSWTASADNVGVTNYAIYRGANGAAPTLLTTTTSAATSYTDTSVMANSTYTYQVQALDAAGNKSLLSDPVGVTIPDSADVSPPTAPSSLTAQVISKNEVDLGWMASTDNVAVSGYRVYRSRAGRNTWTQLATTAGTVTSYQDLSTVRSTGYRYQVSAIDAAGNESTRSNTITVVTPRH